jgi:hypothetical protein
VVTWGAIPNAGSQIQNVTIAVSPPDVSPRIEPGGQAGAQVTIAGLTNGTSYTFTLTATNRQGSGPQGPSSVPVVPAGAPRVTQPPSIVAGNGVVTVSWPQPDGNGDNALTYTVQLRNVATGVVERTVDVGTALSTQIPAVNGQRYTAMLLVSNKYTREISGNPIPSPVSAIADPKGQPLLPGTPTATVGPGDGTVRLSYSAAGANGGTITDYQVSISNGAFFSVGNTLAPTISGHGMALGGSYTFVVRAVNEVGAGANSGASGPASPYTPPAAPAVNCAHIGGNVIQCNWSTGALNGPGPQEVTVNGAVVGGSSGSVNSVGLTFSNTWGITVVVCNAGAAGNRCSQGAHSATTPPPPNPTVSTSRGALYSKPCPVGGGACYYPNLFVSNFTPGPHGFACFGGQSVGGVTYTGTINVDANGTGSLAITICVAANRAAADIRVDGVMDTGPGW